jgi:hypothetical protein
MSDTIELISDVDGFAFSALSAQPSGASKGGVVVIQEIFGLTEHIGDICTEFFADAGYATPSRPACSIASNAAFTPDTIKTASRKASPR